MPTLSVTNNLAFANLHDPARQFGSVRAGGTIGWVMASWPFTVLVGGPTPRPWEVRSIFHRGGGDLVRHEHATYHPAPHPASRTDAGLDRLAPAPRAEQVAHAVHRRPLPARSPSSIQVVHNGYFVMADAFLTERAHGHRGQPIHGRLEPGPGGRDPHRRRTPVLGAVLAELGYGRRKTLIIGILGHPPGSPTFAFAPEAMPTIVAVQLLHGICYAFFFATLYIFVDQSFPKDVRTSAQWPLQPLDPEVGMVVASF